MTRYPNPFAALAELITKAFAVLDDHGSAGRRRALVTVPSRSRARHRSSGAPTPQPRATSTSDSAPQSARPIEKPETMQGHQHTGAR